MFFILIVSCSKKETVIDTKNESATKSTEKVNEPQIENKIMEFPISFKSPLFKQPEYIIVQKSPEWVSRRNHSSHFFSNKIWIIGGSKNGGRGQNSIWFSDNGQKWSSVDLSFWSKRVDHASIVFKDKLWVMGGKDNNNYFSDIWSTDNGIDWVKNTDSAVWGKRFKHKLAVYDNKLWLIGGMTKAGAQSDIWVSNDGLEWSKVNKLPNWQPMIHHTTVSFRNKLWVYQDKEAWYSENGLDWKLGTSNFLGMRYMDIIEYDNCLVMTCGGDGVTYQSDIWVSYDGLEWFKTIQKGLKWSPRINHSTVNFNGFLYIIGGIPYNKDNTFNSLWKIVPNLKRPQTASITSEEQTLETLLLKLKIVKKLPNAQDLLDIDRIFVGSHISDTEFNLLSTLPNVKKLQLRRSKITDFKELLNFEKLELFEVKSDIPFKIPNLSSLKYLNTVILKGSKTSDISFLRGVKQLKSLFISDTEISSILDLKNISLKSLYMDGSKVKDLSILETVSGLENLIINNCNITDISRIKNCSSLRNFDADNTPIKSLEPLSGLKKLSSISLQNGPDLDYAVLKSISGLKILNLRGSKLTEIKDLISTDSQSNIYSLDISGTEVRTLEGISKLPLEYLDLSKTKIKDISALHNHPKLKDINISDCSNIDLAPLATCKKLELIRAKNLSKESEQFLDQLKKSNPKLKISN